MFVCSMQVAAIRGACPAGGCCIAMACDARIMTQHGNIGLNEVSTTHVLRLYRSKIQGFFVAFAMVWLEP